MCDVLGLPSRATTPGERALPVVQCSYSAQRFESRSVAEGFRTQQNEW